MDRRKVTYKLYPNATQAAALAVLLRHHQQLYNAALQERRDAWDKHRVSISYEDQCASLTALRNSGPEWIIANCSSEQVTLRRVKKAYDAFFRRCKAGEDPGYPRFKSLDRMPGFGSKGHGDGWRFTPGPEWQHGKLRLQGVGTLQARGQPRQGGTIKSCELMHKAGAWFLSLTMQCPAIQRDGGNAGGLDWGVETFAVLALPDGKSEPIDNPRFYRTEKRRELELERIRDRRKRRSKRRRKATIRCARLKAKNARRRLDFHHQTSAKLVKRFGLIATETLQISNMTRTAKGTVEKPGKKVAQKAGLNREILDTGPAAFLTMVRYKAEEAGSLFMEAPTRKLKPSQTCPACGRVKKKSLSVRTHLCADCRHSESRDAASARVCLNWAMDQINTREPRCAA